MQNICIVTVCQTASLVCALHLRATVSEGSDVKRKQAIRGGTRNKLPIFQETV